MATDPTALQTMDTSVPQTQSQADVVAAIQKQLTPVQVEQANQIAQRELNPADPNSISTFGSTVEQQLARSVDPLLEKVKVKDTGAVAGMLNSLLDTTRGFNPRELTTDKKKFLGLVTVKAKVKEVLLQFENVKSRVDRFETDLGRQVEVMRRDVSALVGMIESNQTYYKNLLLYAYAGKTRLDALRKQVEAKRNVYNRTQSPQLALEIQTLDDFINRLERRVYDLLVLSQVAMQSDAQMRLIQNGDLALADKLQQTISTVIPLWKQQLVIAITLYRQAEATGVLTKAASTTDELLRSNQEALHTGTVNLAREVDKSVVSIERLEATQQSLIDTINDVVQITQEGQQRRAEGERRLMQMSQTLPDAQARAQALPYSAGSNTI